MEDRRAGETSLVVRRWSLAKNQTLPPPNGISRDKYVFALVSRRARRCRRSELLYNDERPTTHDVVIILSMPLVDQIQKDITAAMKAREEARLSTLRMVKSALQNRAIEKMSPLDDKEAQQVLGTLIKQRKDSIEQFTKGGRQEMADKEAAEITVIESYLPKAASEADIVAGVKAVIAEMGSPTMKDMGTVMKNVMAKFAGQGMRVDGKVVSEAVKKELAGK